MKTVILAVGALALFGMAAVAGEGAGAMSGVWPQWRGPTATGVAEDANPPVEWGEDRNVRWKAPIPGRGHSSPIVWGDRIFLTTAVETGKTVDPDTVKAVETATPGFHRRTARMPRQALQFVVMAFNRSDGSLLWQRTVREEAPHTATHADGSWASGSPVTDGERVYAYFGSYGLHALDMDGNTLWGKRFGHFTVRANFGEGTSPVLCGEMLIISQDQEGPSFIIALDKKTGEKRWRVARDEVTSWSTPLVVQHNGQQQIVTSATKRMRSYEAVSGRLLWEAAGMTGNVVPAPVADKGIVFCMSGFRGSALMAIRLGAARGDITDKPEAIAWSREKGTPYVPSPLLVDGLLYYLDANRGILTCVDAASGEAHYAGQKLEEVKMVYASPVSAADRVYVTARDGLTTVIRKGPVFEVLARNRLDEQVSASAALVGGELFLRGHASLYCIARPRAE